MKHHADCDDRPCACGSGLSFKECRCDRYWERLLGDEQPRWLYYLSLGSRIASIIIVVGYLVLYLYGFATAQQKSPEPQQWGMVVGIWKGVVSLLCMGMTPLFMISLAMLAIWAPDWLDEWFNMMPGVRFASPTWAIVVGGWIVLLLPLVVMIIAALRS